MINHNISYKYPTQLGDVIEIKTYVTKSEGVSSVRRVDMYHKVSGKHIISSETTWCFMSAKTKRPIRITTEIANLFN